MGKIIHPIEPIYDKDSKVLILGSFPSVQSRKELFYYAHPQNQFWKLLEDIFNENIIDKREFLLSHHIALWDVIRSCEITGSLDNTIKKVKVNDIAMLLKHSNIKTIFTTGRKATMLYQKYIEPKLGIPTIYLPSTSPLYSKMKYEEKREAYQKIRNYL